MEETRKGYLSGSYVLRIKDGVGGFTEYRIINDDEGKYRILAWDKGQPEARIIAQQLTADEAWNFLKLIGE